MADSDRKAVPYWRPGADVAYWKQRTAHLETQLSDATTDLAHIAMVLGQDDLDDANKIEAIRTVLRGRDGTG